jgi:hypothetical protein
MGAGSTGTSAPLFPRRPKKRGPFQDVPVMPLAIGGQARIGLLLPGKAARHDHDLMQLAQMLADHHRPDLQMPHRLSPSPGEPIEALTHLAG